MIEVKQAQREGEGEMRTTNEQPNYQNRYIRDAGLHARLHQPLPELLHAVLRWRLVVRVSLDLCDTRDKVHVGGLDDGRAVHDEPPDGVHDREEREGEVVRDEGRGVP